MTGLEGSRLRVADDTREFVEGKVAIFDDSFEHEAWHDGTSTRITLIMDIWHPDLSDEEVKFMTLLQHSKIRAEKKMTIDEEDTFYHIIEKSKDHHQNSDWWKLNEEEEKYVENMFANN